MQGKLRKTKEYFVYFKFFAVPNCGKRSADAVGKRFFELTKLYNGRTRQGISALQLGSGGGGEVLQIHRSKQDPLWAAVSTLVSSSKPI